MVLLNFAIALRNSAGEVVGAIESLRDITDIRRTEAQLEKAREAAVAASRAKSIFLANMSHEIRTPMNAILGFSQLMLGESGISEQQRQRLGTINRSGEHLLALINDILEMAKIEAGRITLNPVTFDLHAILDDMGMLFRQRTDAKRLQLWIERLGDVPRFVHADEGKIRQVLINLLGNAVKFTKEGGIMLRTKGLNSGPAEALVTFEVEDTGMGIAPEEMGKLFSQFEQTETGRNTAGGTGLGLAISREYVRLMGGDMTVTSEVGKGSTFFFTLPLTKADETQMVKTGDVRRVMRLRPGRPEVRVLVVDDIAENRELLSQLLEPLGFKVRYAVNGLEGVAVFETYRPHVILMDLYMPKMDGYEATKRIRGTVGGQETKVIAVTSSAFVEIQNDARAAGADDFISKPFRLTELLEKIQALINAEYEYADDAPAAATLAAAEAKGMTAETVAALPAEFLAKLRAAATDADPDQIVELLGQIAGAHADIASGLREMADRFDYEQILDLLPKGGTV
jgi:signal transduction histidine kinase/DNA-binding response OmpR family regulator